MIIDIDNNGVTIDSKRKNNRKRNIKINRISSYIDSAMYGIIVVVYVILGLTLKINFASGNNAWAVLWPIIFLGSIPSSIYKAIEKRKFTQFSIWGPCLFTYLFIGMGFNLWHPYWIILLIIPAFYLIFNPIDKAIHYAKDGDEDNELFIDDDD